MFGLFDEKRSAIMSMTALPGNVSCHVDFTVNDRVRITDDFLISHQKKCKGRSASRPVYDVFLGGSCGNTVWRRDQVIPYLEKRAISYYDPQRSVWNEHMINEESIAKENSSLFLFVIDPETVNATSFLEIAHFAARKSPKLVVVFLGQSEWKERAHPDDLPDRRRTCDLLDNILTMNDVPVLHSVQEALNLVDEVIIGEKSWSEAMANPMQRLPYMLLWGKLICRQSVGCVVNTWLSLKNEVTKCKGTKYVLFGICQILLIMMMHFFFRTLPLMMLIVPFLAFDIIVATISFIYHYYKTNAAARRRAKLLQQQRISGNSIPVPGRAIVPCNLIAQQIPLNYCFQANNNYSHNTQQNQAACDSSHLLNVHTYNNNVGAANPLRWLNANGFDVFLGSSSRKFADLTWINHLAAPQLHRKGLSFSSELMVERHKRLSALYATRHILYHIPSCQTMLSGMVEVAYFLGHSTLNLTICVPKRAKMLDLSPSDSDEMRKHIERRNESYRMAFCYLREMAEERRCQVFSDLNDALQYVISCSKK